MIGYVTAFNVPYAQDAARRVTNALGDGRSPGAGIFALRRETESPASLGELGCRAENISEAAEIILPSIPDSNPRPVAHGDLEAILRAAWAGDPID